MKREDCRVGMKIYFGRLNGEQTLGRITKINITKANVETLETRGVQRTHAVGQIWRVPFSMMQPASGDAVAGEPAPPVKPTPLTYNPFGDIDNLIMEAIVACYSNLSPENLSCDGEASRAHMQRTYNDLTQKLRNLQAALGRQVSEDEAIEWDQSRREFEAARKTKRADSQVG
jgi:hypothetical protein